MAKRLFDVVMAFLLIVLLSPLLAAAVIAVRMESGGPSLFRQIRVARGGRPFVMLKFRSMRNVNKEYGSLVTVDGDVRITRVGAFLRKAKVDELPQLFNVLKGDMSLVGPRPEVPKYVALYPPELRDVVLSVRPGITDEASLEFRNESELLVGGPDPELKYISEILPRKLQIYASYARHRSFSGDLRILLRTFWVVVLGFCPINRRISL